MTFNSWHRIALPQYPKSKHIPIKNKKSTDMQVNKYVNHLNNTDTQMYKYFNIYHTDT